jgi:transglutaminase-like putative cysteine protease
MRPRSEIGARSIAVNTAFFVALMALAAAAFWPVYQSDRLVVLAAVTIPFGCALAVVGAVFRWPSPVVFGATIASYFLLGVPLAVPAQATISGFAPSLGGLGELSVATALSWKQLLTVDLPVGAYQALLVPAFILILCGTVLGLSLVLRIRAGAIGVLAPVGVFVGAIVLGSADQRPLLPLGFAFLLVALLWMLWRARSRRRSARALLGDQLAAEPRRTGAGARGPLVRPVLIGIAVLALAVVAGTTGAAYLAPANARQVLRTGVERPFDPRNYASPLASFRKYWEEPTAEQELFSVTGAPAGSRIRLATLDSYDGIVFSVGSDAVSSESGAFARVPSSVEQELSPGSTEVSVAVEVKDYSGVWLPTVGNLESIQFGGERASELSDAFFFNRNSSTAAVLGGIASGDSYTIRTVVPAVPSDAQLAAGKPGSDPVPAPLNVPDEVESFVSSATAGADSPGTRLLAIVEALRSDGYLSHGLSDDEPFSRSGHSADRIAQLLTDSPMVGDGEQYAVAAALMADQLGFPSRVVLGFLPKAGGGPVVGSDVQAWIEVDYAGLGWVPIDVTPDYRDIPVRKPDETQQVAKPEVVVPPPPAADDEAIEPHRPDAAEDQQNKPDTDWALFWSIARGVGIGLVIAAVVLAPFLTILVAKFGRRRRRKRAPDPVRRIAGAWDDVVDTATDYGYRIPVGATRVEVAELVDKDAVLVLAQTADEAVFGRDRMSEAVADRYWQQFDALRDDWSRDYTRWERIKAALALTSLRRDRTQKNGRGKKSV